MPTGGGQHLVATGLGHPEVEQKSGVYSSAVWCLPSVGKALGSIPRAAKNMFFSRTEVGLLPLCFP